MVSIFLTKQLTIKQLVRRLTFYFFLALIASWGLLAPRLFIFHLEPTRQNSIYWLYLDVTCLTLVIYSVFMIFYNNAILRPRLQRLIDLNEAQW
ncbi:MAG: hypothetical protein LBI10_10280 [Deltaproteobacteria bacterium]|jgi:hypothetical protein|nr:hypothetical protein [Deltaproteobacteria bacterium]